MKWITKKFKDLFFGKKQETSPSKGLVEALIGRRYDVQFTAAELADIRSLSRLGRKQAVKALKEYYYRVRYEEGGRGE